MTRIYTEVVYEWCADSQSYVRTSAIFNDYVGDIAECKGGGSPPANQTVTNKSEPWAEQKPYLQRGFANAENLYNQGYPGQFPGPHVVDQPLDNRLAYDWTKMIGEAEADPGKSIQGTGRNNLVSTLRGDYYIPTQNQTAAHLFDTMGGKNLYGGAGFNAAVNAAAENILPQIDSRYAASGRYGSGLNRDSSLKALGNVFAGQYGQERALQQNAAQQLAQNFQNERTNSLRGLALAPGTLGMAYMPGEKYAQTGAHREESAQDRLNDQIKRFNYDQFGPKQNLTDYMQNIQGNYGGSSTQTGPNPNYQGRGNRFANVLGGGLGGAQLGSMFGPMGAGIGGGLGLLGGLFGL